MLPTGQRRWYGYSNVIVEPVTLIGTVRSGRAAGPCTIDPSAALNLLPWQGQLIVPPLTSATVHPWWVHIALNALNSPDLGWVTTMSRSPRTTPPPTGIAEVTNAGWVVGTESSPASPVSPVSALDPDPAPVRDPFVRPAQPPRTPIDAAPTPKSRARRVTASRSVSTVGRPPSSPLTVRDHHPRPLVC